MNRALFLLFLTMAALAVACSDSEPAATGCTDIAMPSTWVTVVDVDGNVIEDAVVAYISEGDVYACEPNGPPGEWTCGHEVRELTIRVAKDGYVTEEVFVEPGFDGCHVIREDVEVTLRLEAD